MTDQLALDAIRTAAAVAPVVDRLRMGASRAMKSKAAEELADHALEPSSFDVLGNLRNIEDDWVPVEAVEAVFAYWPAGQVREDLTSLVEAGYVQLDGGLLRLAERGTTLIGKVRGFGEAALVELWPAQEERVSALAPLVTRVLGAAQADGGPAFSVMVPRPSFSGSGALLLAEQLTGLRFHRYEAHVAAWRAAGRTAEEMAGLGPGPEREEIEVATNRLAATPYAVLSPDERLALLAGLAALPN